MYLLKEFKISGRIIVDEDITHEELLERLYICLKIKELHFIGETRKIVNKK